MSRRLLNCYVLKQSELPQLRSVVLWSRKSTSHDITLQRESEREREREREEREREREREQFEVDKTKRGSATEFAERAEAGGRLLDPSAVSLCVFVLLPNP